MLFQMQMLVFTQEYSKRRSIELQRVWFVNSRFSLGKLNVSDEIVATRSNVFLNIPV